MVEHSAIPRCIHTPNLGFYLKEYRRYALDTKRDRLTEDSYLKEYRRYALDTKQDGLTEDSYLKEYRRYALDTKQNGRMEDGGTLRMHSVITICLQSSFGGA